MDRRYNAGLSWLIVFVWLALIIGMVIYLANVPLGNILLDGLKLENGLF